MVNFPTWITDCDSHSPALLNLFLLMLVFVLQWLSLHWEILIMLFFQFQIDFPGNWKQDALFHLIARDYYCTDWGGLYDHLRDVPWEDIFKLSASGAVSEFCEWVQVGIDVYIPHCKCQFKPHLFLWFWTACVAAIVHKNHFFGMYQQNKSSEPKIKFRQASNHYKRVLEAAKLVYGTKTKRFHHFPEIWLPRLL